MKAKGGGRSHARLASVPASPAQDYKAAPQAAKYGGGEVAVGAVTLQTGSPQRFGKNTNTAIRYKSNIPFGD